MSTTARHASPTPLYQRYSAEEDRRRTNEHYALPAEFFVTVTGGRWNTYSGNLWDGVNDVTESQERKLDRLATLLQLAPADRILDVGCGWGGPLVYLCEAYGTRGVGLTLSPAQKAWADVRIAQHRVAAEVIERHWQDYNDGELFDAVYSDEASVHFHDLRGYFQKAGSLLRPGGLILNKELHFTHPRYASIGRALGFVNEIFGETGNYRTLAEELGTLGEAGFDIRFVEQIPLENYWRTADGWLANLRRDRTHLQELVGPVYYRRYKKFLEIARKHLLRPDMVTLDIVVAKKAEVHARPA